MLLPIDSIEGMYQTPSGIVIYIAACKMLQRMLNKRFAPQADSRPFRFQRRKIKFNIVKAIEPLLTSLTDGPQDLAPSKWRNCN